MVYEANVSPLMRFMVDLKLAGGGWLVVSEREPLPADIYHGTQEAYAVALDAIESRAPAAFMSVDSETGIFKQRPMDSKWTRHAPMNVMTVEMGTVLAPQGTNASLPSPAKGKRSSPVKSSKPSTVASQIVAIACRVHWGRCLPAHHDETLVFLLDTTLFRIEIRIIQRPTLF